MRGKPLVAALMLPIAVTACTRSAPAYESHYEAPPPPATRPLLPPGASFVDDFDRPDGQDGLGTGWQLRRANAIGKPVLQSTSDGFVDRGRFMFRGNASTYAVRHFDGVVRRVGMDGIWNQTGVGESGYMVAAIANNDGLQHDTLELVVSQRNWIVQTRRSSGAARRHVSGVFTPPLEFGREYRFQMTAEVNGVSIQTPAGQQKVNIGTAGLLGNVAFWQHYASPTAPPVGARFGADRVWAAIENEPFDLLPPDPN